MSGHPQYSSDDNFPYPSYATVPTASYTAPTLSQYTQSQINTHYQQYHSLPPQPYQTITDYYTRPVVVPTTYGQSTSLATGYGSHHGGSQSGLPESHRLAPPLDEEEWQRKSPTKTNDWSRSNSHTRIWTCNLQQCTSTARFTRLADLQRHQSTVHGIGTPDFPCTVLYCTRTGSKGFTRRDHLVEHLRNFHHLDIPKRRPGERSAGPPLY